MMNFIARLRAPCVTSHTGTATPGDLTYPRPVAARANYGTHRVAYTPVPTAVLLRAASIAAEIVACVTGVS